MKNFKRLIAVVLCVLMMTSVLYGCSINIVVKYGDPEVTAGAAIPAASEAQGTVPSQTATQAPAVQNTQTTAAQASPADTTAASPQPTETAQATSEPSSTAEIMAEYVKVYNTTKASGKFLGKEHMQCASVIIEGKEQSMVTSAADKLMATDETGLPLPPYTDTNPGNECLLTADDVSQAAYKNNGDGTATITFTPKETVNSKRLADSQGKTFNVLEDVADTVASMGIITWAEGDENSNVTLTMKEGTVEVTYDIATKMMTKAEYVLVTYADITHCNVLIFKDKGGTAKFVYTMSYPG